MSFPQLQMIPHQPTAGNFPFHDQFRKPSPYMQHSNQYNWFMNDNCNQNEEPHQANHFYPPNPHWLHPSVNEVENSSQFGGDHGFIQHHQQVMGGPFQHAHHTPRIMMPHVPRHPFHPQALLNEHHRYQGFAQKHVLPNYNVERTMPSQSAYHQPAQNMNFNNRQAMMQCRDNKAQQGTFDCTPSTMYDSSRDGLQVQTPSPTLHSPNPTEHNRCNTISNITNETLPNTNKNDWELECMGVTIKLATSELWKQFENVDLEMVISNNGRRMFPPLEYDISGLEPTKFYNVFIDFVIVSDHIWRYCDHAWKPNGPAPPEEPGYHPVQRMYVHPQSPSSGSSWNKNRVYFRKMKLSNHLHNETEKIVTLRTLLKYQPRLHIVEVSPQNPTIQSNLRTYVLPKTKFITVTLYHDTDVAQLKINLNPFARSFREKPINEHSDQESAYSPLSEMSSPLTSPEDIDGSRRHASNDVEGIEYFPKDIVTVSNPAPSADVNVAKRFLENQLSVMSDLVKSSNDVDVPAASICNDKPHGSTNVHYNGPGTELDDILKSKTIHHFPQEKSDMLISSKIDKCDDKKTPALRDFQLLNVDRCFPPNQLAPVSHSLPFDPAQLQRRADDRAEKLPVFYECSYYREQTAANHNKLKQDNIQLPSTSSGPVIYIPQNTVNDKEALSRNFYCPPGSSDRDRISKTQVADDFRSTSKSTIVENDGNPQNEQIEDKSDTGSGTCEQGSMLDIIPQNGDTADPEGSVHDNDSFANILVNASTFIPQTNRCSTNLLGLNFQETFPNNADVEKDEISDKDPSTCLPASESLSAQFFSSDLPTPSLNYLKQFFIEEPDNILFDSKKRKHTDSKEEDDSLNWLAKRTCVSADSS